MLSGLSFRGRERYTVFRFCGGLLLLHQCWLQLSCGSWCRLTIEDASEFRSGYSQRPSKTLALALALVPHHPRTVSQRLLLPVFPQLKGRRNLYEKAGGDRKSPRRRGDFGQVSPKVLPCLDPSGDLKQHALLPSIAPRSAPAAKLYDYGVYAAPQTLGNNAGTQHAGRSCVRSSFPASRQHSF